MARQFAVIGMGRVGASMVQTLDSLGHEVLGIDRDEELIEDLSAKMPNATLISADATDDTVLGELGLDRFDGAAVVIGENIQASVLVTLMLKELGLPLVISRANSPVHARVLERVGADYVVQPEREFGEFLARRMNSPGVMDYVELGEDEALVEMKVPREWVGKTLIELQLPRKRGLTVLAIKPEGKQGTLPRPDATLHETDVLIVGGHKDKMDDLGTG